MLRTAAVLLSACVLGHGKLTYPTKEETSQFFQRFQTSPRQVMDEPVVHQRNGAPPTLPFSAEQVESGSFVQAKLQQREKIMAQAQTREAPPLPQQRGGRALAEQTRNAANLVDNGRTIVTRVGELETQAGNEYTLPVQAWSANYWPLYKGALGDRYAEHRRSGSFYEAYNGTYVHRPSENYTLENRHLLSPAEKYDIIVGDKEWALTKFSWEQGKEYADRDEDGEVETWMGLCHGWAPAAFMLPRPQRAINVKDPNGDDLIFYPSDVKALGTMLWAHVPFETNFLGGRCNTKDVERDEESGRILDSTCFDVNPGTWHISIMNQLGISKRSMILDVTYDYQVWNQPLLGYNVQYVNPQTSEVFDDSASATIPMESYTEDKFKEYRGSEATHVVGVSMTIFYGNEIHASHDFFNTEDDDSVSTVTYRYDLELDEDGEILGGEWYQTKHPDFLWTPVPEAVPSSRYTFAEHHTGFPAWNEGESLPARWGLYARYTAQYGYLQTMLVGELFKRAATPLPATPAPPTPVPPTQSPPTPAPPADYYPFECERVTTDLGEAQNSTTTLVHPATGDYESREDRCWRFSCNDTWVGTWEKFDTEAGYDFVTVFAYDKASDSWDQTMRRSGDSIAPVGPVTGPVVVRFTSDGSVTRGGFSLTAACGTVVDAADSPADSPVDSH